MQRSNDDHIDILSDLAVFDYVAGNLSEDSRAIFEKKLADSVSLQEAVEDERRLRKALLEIESMASDSEAISAGNIDNLFKTLDGMSETPIVFEGSAQQQTAGFQAWRPTGTCLALTGICISLAFAFNMIFGYQPEVDQDFKLLSDVADSSQIDFGNLVKEQKIAQIWLADDFPPAKLSKLFTDYELTPIGRAGQTWVVSSSRTLAPSMLAKLEAVEGVKQVGLISFEDPDGRQTDRGN